MTIDADAQKVIALMKAAGRPKLNTLSPQEARQAYRDSRGALEPEKPEVGEVRDLEAASARGPIPLRLYRGLDAPAGPLPTLIYMHGGGWVIGDRDTHDYVCRKLANATRAAVVSVDYRMAPEHPFPIPLEDCAAAARWIAAQARELGLDPARLAVGGDSAGGNLAAVLCLMARDGDGPRFVHQALLYPATDLAEDYSGGPGADDSLPLTNAMMGWFRDLYVGSRRQGADWRASPLRAASLAGVAPAFVLTARHDPLGAEGRAYADRLEAAGVRVWRLDLSDQVHGFLTMGRVIRAADAALDMCAAALRLAYATAD